MSTLSLLRPPSTTLGEYFERVLDGELVTLSTRPLADSPMRLLSPVERATVRIVAPHASAIRTNKYGIAIEAAIRITIWRDRGSRFSGWAMADALQQFFAPHAHAGQPWRGWELLREIDASSSHHGVQVYLDAEPEPHDPKRHRPMRLGARLNELESERCGRRR